MVSKSTVDGCGASAAAGRTEPDRWPYIPEWITAFPWEGLYDPSVQLAAELASRQK